MNTDRIKMDLTYVWLLDRVGRLNSLGATGCSEGAVGEPILLHSRFVFTNCSVWICGALDLSRVSILPMSSIEDKILN